MRGLWEWAAGQNPKRRLIPIAQTVVSIPTIRPIPKLISDPELALRRDAVRQGNTVVGKL